MIAFSCLISVRLDRLAFVKEDYVHKTNRSRMLLFD